MYRDVRFFEPFPKHSWKSKIGPIQSIQAAKCYVSFFGSPCILTEIFYMFRLLSLIMVVFLGSSQRKMSSGIINWFVYKYFIWSFQAHKAHGPRWTRYCFVQLMWRLILAFSIHKFCKIGQWCWFNQHLSWILCNFWHGLFCTISHVSNFYYHLWSLIWRSGTHLATITLSVALFPMFTCHLVTGVEAVVLYYSLFGDHVANIYVDCRATIYEIYVQSDTHWTSLLEI